MLITEYLSAMAEAILPVAPKYQKSLDDLARKSNTAYLSVTEDSKHSNIVKFLKFKVAENWIFQYVLIFSMIPIANWLRSIGNPKKEAEKSLAEYMKELDEN